MLNRTFRHLRPTVYLLILFLLALSQGCKKAKFKGNGGKKTSEKVSECESKGAINGVNVAFIIDNSFSNSITDCPNAKDLGTVRGQKQVECGGQTNREKAVLAAFDDLFSYEKSEAGFEGTISVASFPSSAIYSGFDIRHDWLPVAEASKAPLSTALTFVRKPAGATPYLSALDGAKALFSKLSGNTRPNLALLVTDGEPTDPRAQDVKARGEELKKMNVKVVTVFITNGKSRSQRQAEHIQILRSEGQSQANIDELLGLNGKTSVIDSISSEKVDDVNIKDLAGVFRAVIKKSVECK